MAINFPANPTPNDVFTDGGKSWIWDGVTWKIYSSSTTGIGLGDLSVTTLSVGTAALSYNQSTGVLPTRHQIYHHLLHNSIHYQQLLLLF